MAYTFRCLNSSYDETNQVLVLLVFCEDFGEQRVLYIPKSDFHYKIPGVEVPNNEMHKTAELFRNKRFKMDIRDDPNRRIISPEEKQEEVGRFKDYVTSKLETISDELVDVDKNTIKRLADVVERDRCRKEKHPPTVQDVLDELGLRAKFNL